jgi:hypothetical protein
MLIGGGLTIASGGALSPLMAGMITGGGFGLATGSLKKGLMAGLGAYGGAGIGSALAGAGTAQGLMAGNAASQTAMGGAANAKDLLLARGAETAAPGMFGNAAANFSNAGAGITGLGSEAGRSAFMSQIGGAKGLGMAGLAAAAPMMTETATKQPEIKSDANMGQRYQFNAGTQTPTPTPDVPGYENQSQNFGKERQYFNPMYRPIDNPTARTMYGFASGGPVEAMSDANSIGMNTGYPQADVETGAYATPYQQPISRNVVTGVQGAGINPYTGQAQFAEGGEVGGYTYDPVTQMYVKKGGEGATMVSPTGGISGASAGAGGSPNQPLSQQTIDFLDKEAAIPGARDARMQGISDLISMAVPGYGAINALSGLLGTATAGQIANAFGGTQAPAPVGERGTYAGVPGELNDAQQFSFDQDAANNAQVGASEQAAANEAAGPSGAGTADGGDGYARGGISHLGDYSDGGRLLRGPGDGISDSIPATIGKKRPARLADGEFVVPARIVSELGNGSTEAGARKLYAMMDRVQKSRGKTVGKGKIATNSRAEKYLPA